MLSRRKRLEVITAIDRLEEVPPTLIIMLSHTPTGRRLCLVVYVVPNQKVWLALYELKRDGMEWDGMITDTDSLGNTCFAFSVEARIEETNLNGVRTLAYYGGALGHFLVIHPDGEMYITGRRRVPQGHKDDKEDEEDVGVAEENPTDGGNDSVAIRPPPENASVAEAKPVAVSIAGEGGVASAQPVGQAIVGPGGLAISRPVATAIAGIPGAENLVLKPEKAPGRATTGYIYSVYHPQALVPQPFVYPSADSQRFAVQHLAAQPVAAQPLTAPQPLAAQTFGPQPLAYHHLQPLVHLPNYYY